MYIHTIITNYLPYNYLFSIYLCTENLILIAAIGRKCGNAGSAPNLCSDMSLGGATVTICSCDQDYCNIATKLQIPYVFLLSLLFIASKRSVLWSLNKLMENENKAILKQN